MISKSALVLMAFTLLLNCNDALGAESDQQKLVRYQNQADDLEHAHNFAAALRVINDALAAGKSLDPFDEKVSELRARRLRYLLALGLFPQFKKEMSEYLAQAPQIEHSFRGADAVIELDALHEALSEYCAKHDSEEALKMHLQMTRVFKKCGFSTNRMIAQMSQYYIKKKNYKPLGDLGGEFIRLNKGSSILTGEYLVFLSMDKTGRKKEASAYLAKVMASDTEFSRLEKEVQLANAMNETLQFDEAEAHVSKAISGLQKLEKHASGSPKATDSARYYFLEARARILKCHLDAQKKDYAEMIADSQRGQACMDEAARVYPQGSRNTASLDAYKDIQGLQEKALRAQGKSAEADRIRAARFKQRFGGVFE